METTKVTIGTKIRKEIATLLLRMISLQMSMNMEMYSTTWTELYTTEDLQEEKGVNLKIEINPVHHMQEAMQLMLTSINLKAKQ